MKTLTDKNETTKNKFEYWYLVSAKFLGIFTLVVPVLMFVCIYALKTETAFLTISMLYIVAILITYILQKLSRGN